jgi:hypothetical protein
VTGQVNAAQRTRDAADARVRNARRGVVALAVVLGGVFAAVAASATPHRTPAATTTTSRAPVRTRHRTRVVVLPAPAPPLVSVQSDEGAAAPPAAPAPPTAAPAPVQAPPVVVSGGS